MLSEPMLVSRQLGRKGGRRPKMTESKLAYARSTLLAGGVPPQRTLSVRFFPFSETTPKPFIKIVIAD